MLTVIDYCVTGIYYYVIEMDCKLMFIIKTNEVLSIIINENNPFLIIIDCIRNLLNKNLGIENSMTQMEEIQSLAESYIKNYNISGEDLKRPWGGFYYIDDKDLEKFMEEYFSEIKMDNEGICNGKILLISPGKRLSWQYHHRRKEIWSVLLGPVGIVTSDNDEEKDMVILDTGNIINIDRKERHRLVGLNNYAIIAELWCHTDVNHPSDEADIIRLQDDYKRF